jgi:hypothetical protein
VARVVSFAREALNAVCAGRILEVDQKWNVTSSWTLG